MKPVFMTSFGWPHGNCWAASIASIFEVPLESLPDEAIRPKQADEPDDVWTPLWDIWLAARGLRMMTFAAWEDTPGGGQKQITLPGYSILSCHVLGAPLMADGTTLQHATVALDGKIVHNPQPGCEDNSSLWPWTYTTFQLIDPAKPVGNDASGTVWTYEDDRELLPCKTCRMATPQMTRGRARLCSGPLAAVCGDCYRKAAGKEPADGN